MNIIGLPKIRVIVHKGERFGHQKASYTLMKNLRELGFKGQFEILYEDLYPEHVIGTKYRPYVAASSPIANANNAPQPMEAQHKIYFNKLASLMNQLLPRYRIEYDHIEKILKNTYIDAATMINHIDSILCQSLNPIEAELKAVQDSYDEAYTNLVQAFKREIITEQSVELPATKVRLSCNLPPRAVVEAAAQPNEKQLLDFVHTHNDSVAIQLVYGLKPLVVATDCSTNVGCIGKKLEVIFSGYRSPNIANDSTSSEPVALKHPVLGELMITRLPSNCSEWHLDQTPVSFIAATDKLKPRDKPTATYATDICVVTQPTNWKEKCFIDIADQSKTILTIEQLCIFSYHGKQYSIDLNNSSAIIAMCESAVFSADSKLLAALNEFRAARQRRDAKSYMYRDIGLLNSMRFNAQRYGKLGQSIRTNIKKCYRDPLEQLKDLICFYNTNKSCMKKPYVLLMPNFEKVFPNMGNDEIIDRLGNNVKIIKDPGDINENDDCIYILRTGNLHPEVFDYLTALPNMLPAIVEGCNAVELCEYNGVPFLMVIRDGQMVQELFNQDENFNYIQNLHIDASLFLSYGKQENKQAYIDYMHLAIHKPNELEKYFQQRKEIYKNTCSDVIDRSLQVLAAVELVTSDNSCEFKKAPSPSCC